MGHSQTINVIGFSKEESIGNDTFRRHECHAMNKMEMAQEARKMEKRGTPVVGWYAQTNRGCQMIGCDAMILEEIKTEGIKYPKLVKCPICNGQGSKAIRNGVRRGCVVCNSSGITKQNYWNKWQEWQLESIRKDFD